MRANGNAAAVWPPYSLLFAVVMGDKVDIISLSKCVGVLFRARKSCYNSRDLGICLGVCADNWLLSVQL